MPHTVLRRAAGGAASRMLWRVTRGTQERHKQRKLTAPELRTRIPTRPWAWSARARRFAQLVAWAMRIWIHERFARRGRGATHEPGALETLAVEGVFQNGNLSEGGSDVA